MMGDFCIDVVAENGVPFRVVYGHRKLLTGHTEPYPTVAFYDRRYSTFTVYGGQFVSDYKSDDLIDRDNGYGLNLYGGEDDWTIDTHTMRLIIRWLSDILTRSGA